MSQAPSTADDAPYGTDVPVPARQEAFRNGDYPMAVYGLGKIGLPVAAAFAELTGTVTGVDPDESVVQTVAAGESPIPHEPGLDETIADLRDRGALRATTDGTRAAGAACIHVIVVPVPIDATNSPDLTAVEEVIRTIADGLAPGDLVVVETTVPPGTCAETVAPGLSAASGLEPESFGVASCPERTSSGRALTDIKGAYPRVIGGVNPASTRAAYAVYDTLVDNRVIRVDARTAELVKLFEGVYRDVNIALANELAKAFDGSGVDVREAIAAANTQPYCDIHEPGAGVGGHCIPWYPHFLVEASNVEMPLLGTARAVNESMPIHVAERTLEALDRDEILPSESTIAVLGLAYRPEIPETAASPTYPLLDRLTEAGASVRVIDPVVETDGADVDLCPLEDLPALEPDACVLVTAHRSFEDIPREVLAECIVVDGRDAIDGIDRTVVIGSEQ